MQKPGFRDTQAASAGTRTSSRKDGNGQERGCESNRGKPVRIVEPVCRSARQTAMAANMAVPTQAITFPALPVVNQSQAPG